MKLVHAGLVVALLSLSGLVLSAGRPDDGSAGFGEPPAAGAGPVETVAGLEAALLASMKAGGDVGFSERTRHLEPVVLRVLDVSAMARFMFGARWRDLDAASRRDFIEAFGRLSVATYAARFVDHTGQSFEHVDHEIDGSRATVRSRLIRPEAEPIPFEYLLRHSDEGWRVVNIMADGISELALRRSRYTRLYEQGGMDAVVDDIHEQIGELGHG